MNGERISRTASKLIPPPSSLDRGLHAFVLLLWCSVGATWLTARSRLAGDEIAIKLAATNGHRSVLKEIDWWKTGRAKLSTSPGIESSRMRRLGRAKNGLDKTAADALIRGGLGLSENESAQESAETEAARGRRLRGLVPPQLQGRWL